MNYSDLLVSTAKKWKSIVCLGLDPVLEKIPINETNLRKKIFIFFESILNEIVRQNIYPSAVKPNYAFYAQYGFDGLHALKDVISLYQHAGLPVILDAKRGDIGSTSQAYARECFEFFNADAVTLSPYMGYDSIHPFLTFNPDKGIYVLCRTSNKSAIDFQDLITDGSPLYMKVAEKICEWNSNNIGAVIGATYPRELENILCMSSNYDKKIPFEPLAECGLNHIKTLILVGATKYKIKEAFENEFNKTGTSIPVFLTDTFEEAVMKAKESAEPGDIVTLSPACASFDLFPNFEKRGNVFKEIVNRL